jgi:hypothetical protein
MPIFKVGDKVKDFLNRKGVITEINSKLNPSIHKKEEVQMVKVLIEDKEKEYFYRDLKHDN